PSNTFTMISRVMTAVVACASSVGGSPIIATRSTPPVFAAAGLDPGACASPSEAASHAASVSTVTTADARRTRTMSTPPVGSVRYRGPPPPESDRDTESAMVDGALDHARAASTGLDEAAIVRAACASLALVKLNHLLRAQGRDLVLGHPEQA